MGYNQSLIIAELEKWLDKPGNTTSKLAYLMEYKTSMTIEHWRRNRRVSIRAVNQLLDVIKGGKCVSKSRTKKG
jgi:hypothetical protein